MSQADLARLVDLHQQRIGKWEVGIGTPSMEQGLRLARALSLSYDYLADDSLDDPSSPELTEDERAVLDLVRAMGLGRIEAMRRLATPPVAERVRDPERVPDVMPPTPLPSGRDAKPNRGARRA